MQRGQEREQEGREDLVGQLEAGAGLDDADEEHGDVVGQLEAREEHDSGWVDQTEHLTTLGDSSQLGSRTENMESQDPTGFQAGHHRHVGVYRLAREEAATEQEARVYSSAL